MAGPSYIPSFYFYKFAEGISAPFTALQAFKAGAIDANGNLLKPESSIDPLEYLIIKLKKIFEELPFGMTKAKLGNYLSTLQLFGEEVAHFGITDSEYAGLMEGQLVIKGYPEVSYIALMEDMSAGGMASAGSSPGYNTGQVSGMDPVMAPMQRRKPVLKGLDSCEMFDVCPEEFKQFQGASDWKYVPDSDTKKYVRRYQLRNPEGTVALRSVDPDTGKSNVHWINFSNKEKKQLKESYSSAAKDLANIAVQNIVNPPEIDINPSTGKLKRGARTQRVGFAFSALADILKGGKRHQEKTADVLIPQASNEVSSGGKDTMVYDQKRGIFVPADLKADNTTPFTHISDEQTKFFPGLPELGARLQKILERGRGLSKDQKTEVRRTASQIGERSRTQLGNVFQQGILGISPQLNWVITPGQSDKPYLYPGLVTQVSPELIQKYGRSSARPTLSPRPGKRRVEFKVRGREPSVQEVAQELTGSGSVSTSAEDILGSMEAMISPGLRRQVQGILAPYLRRVR
jgi:hypothetical protein